MIKTWTKFNESNSFELTNEMIIDLIIFRQYTVENSSDVKNIMDQIKNNQILIEASDEWDSIGYDNNETFITNKIISDFDKYVSEIMIQIQKDEEQKADIKNIWLAMKKIFGKVPTFIEIIDMSVDILDSKYKTDFELRASGTSLFMSFSYFKVCDIKEHISSIDEVETIIGRIKNRGIDIYLDSFNYDWTDDEQESRTLIKISI